MARATASAADGADAPGVLNLRPVVEGLVYRSSAPFGWDAHRVAGFLAEHRIETVVDLRSPAESALVPWLLDARAQGEPLPELLSAPLDPTEGRPSSRRSIDTARDLGELYLWWAEERPDMVARSLAPIAAGRTTLLHCAAGKDRTGVVSAVVHLAAGHEPEDIVGDYARTSAALPQILSALHGLYVRTHPGEELPAFAADAPPVILTAPAEAMEVFLERFLDRHGTVEDYLLSAGLDRPALARLQHELRR
ncbi:tyrosine-protein phosphatase [Zafaria sp. Z1313]|uniref:tyrosine-protein phosphatase n=1 Tax=Zafaria sp. Z1313 TaxID=3423202 RepID=UPI003D302A9E